jgi:hypothetical protein
MCDGKHAEATFPFSRAPVPSNGSPSAARLPDPANDTQYRSSIFYANEDQKRVGEAYIRQLDEAKAFRHPIVTKVVPLEGLYAAGALVFHGCFRELKAKTLAGRRRSIHDTGDFAKDSANAVCDSGHEGTGGDATNPAINAYSMRSWPRVSFQILSFHINCGFIVLISLFGSLSSLVLGIHQQDYLDRLPEFDWKGRAGNI